MRDRMRTNYPRRPGGTRVTLTGPFREVFAARVRRVVDRCAIPGVWNRVLADRLALDVRLPFTPCLDVTLRVRSVPAVAQAALRLEADFVELSRDPQRWAFRSLHAEVEDGDLVVRATLLEPLEDLYDVDPGDERPEQAATDVVLALLNANCPAWRALDVRDQRVSAHTRRVRRRFWTDPPDPG